MMQHRSSLGYPNRVDAMKNNRFDFEMTKSGRGELCRMLPYYTEYVSAVQIETERRKQALKQDKSVVSKFQTGNSHAWLTHVCRAGARGGRTPIIHSMQQQPWNLRPARLTSHICWPFLDHRRIYPLTLFAPRRLYLKPSTSHSQILFSF